MSWLYQGQPFDPQLANEYYGFIYLITNLKTGQKYIGRKFFTKAGTYQKKGKKRKIRKESDWKDYWSSCEELIADVAKYGQKNFTREIVRLCKGLGECKYQETQAQFLSSTSVLTEKLPSGLPAYYNANICVKYTRRNIGL